MTSEEAKRCLYDVWGEKENRTTNEILALEMAIIALDHEPKNGRWVFLVEEREVN